MNPFVKKIPKELEEDYFNNLLEYMLEYNKNQLNNLNNNLIYDYIMVVLHLS